MSEREASVKLTLDDGQYLVSMRKVGDEGEKAGKKGHKSMTLFGQGVHGATHAVHGLHKSLETVTELVTGLAAGFSLEEALKTTVELDAKFKHLAFRISGANGEMVTAHELQEMVEQSAAKAGRRTVEMADSFEKLVKATGNSKFAEESLTAIGVTATATGESVESLTHLAEELHEKFEVGGAQMADVLAQVVDASQHGGPQIEQFADVAGNMGAELAQAGLDGKRGLDFMIGSLTQLKSHVGSLPKAVKGVKAMLLGLGDKTKLGDIAKHAQIDPAKLLNEKDLLGRLRMIMGRGKIGLDALKGSMHEAEEQKALKVLFLDPFQAALEKAVEGGKKGKSALDAALDQLDENVARMGASALDASDLQREANERMQDPQMQLQHAMEELEKAFAQPEIISAINDLSLYLPKAAGALASFVKFAVNHPLLAGGAVVGAKAGMGFTGAIAEALIHRGMHAASHGAGKGFKSLAGMVGDTDTMKAASAWSKSIEGAHVAGGMKVGSLIQGAGAAAGILIAGAMAAEWIKHSADESGKATGDLSAAGAVASSTRGNWRQQQEQADELRDAIARKKDSRSGASGILEDVFGGIGKLVEPGLKSSGEQGDEQIKEMEELLRKKDEHIAELRKKDIEAIHGKPGGREGEGADHKANGKAVADALKSGAPVRVHIDNLGSFGGMPAGGGNGSRGPTKPAAPHHGGGY
jgi:hypothetical protein